MRHPNLIQFFATRQDLSGAIKTIDQNRRLNIVEQRYYISKNVPTYNSLASIPNREVVTYRTSARYLVLPFGEAVNPVRTVQIAKRSNIPRSLALGLAIVGIKPPGGSVVYDIQPSNHPSSITFAPGGFLTEKTIIAGEISTVHSTSSAVELFKLFTNEIFNGFVMVKSFWVGPEAMFILKSGGRLTVDAKAAPFLDLTLS